MAAGGYEVVGVASVEHQPHGEGDATKVFNGTVDLAADERDGGYGGGALGVLPGGVPPVVRDDRERRAGVEVNVLDDLVALD